MILKFFKLLIISSLLIIPRLVNADISSTHDATQQKKISYHIVPPYNMNIYTATIESFFKNDNWKFLSLEQRLNKISSFFLDQPYTLFSAGEGPQGYFDQNPLFRTDGFDCMTYVSTVLAIIESNSISQFQNNIKKINYLENTTTFANRLHFTTDWNTKNHKNGYLEDITQSLFPNEIQISKTWINKPNWFRHLDENRIQLLQTISSKELQKKVVNFHKLANNVTAEQSTLAFIPLTTFYDRNGQENSAAFDKIPANCVIEIVRPNWNLQAKIGTNIDISHLGLTIRKNHILYFREASAIKKKVIDIPLSDYLKNYLTSRTVKGIHIEKIILEHN